jgi:hypothetical protein
VVNGRVHRARCRGLGQGEQGDRSCDALLREADDQQFRLALEDADEVRTRTEFMALQNMGLTKKQIVDGFHESMTKPFTGSLANDKKFYRSLDEAGQHKFDATMERRVVIINRFNAWLPSGAKNVTRQSL